MERDFVTIDQLVLDMQRILRRDPESAATIVAHPEVRTFEVRCGKDSWTVKLTKFKSESPDRQVLFSPRDSSDVLLKTLNDRGCLRVAGFPICGCGNDRLHVPADVHRL